MKCEQTDCNNEAEFSFIWPGQKLAAACPKHAAVASNVARVMGFDLLILPAYAREHEEAQKARELLAKSDEPSARVRTYIDPDDDI